MSKQNPLCNLDRIETQWCRVVTLNSTKYECCEGKNSGPLAIRLWSSWLSREKASHKNQSHNKFFFFFLNLRWTILLAIQSKRRYQSFIYLPLAISFFFFFFLFQTISIMLSWRLTVSLPAFVALLSLSGWIILSLFSKTDKDMKDTNFKALELLWYYCFLPVCKELLVRSVANDLQSRRLGSIWLVLNGFPG